MREIRAIQELIDEAERVRLFHKARYAAGYIEALAASIRIKALRDALRAVQASRS